MLARRHIGDVLVEERREVAAAVLLEVRADGTARTVARLEEAEVSDVLLGRARYPLTEPVRPVT